MNNKLYVPLMNSCVTAENRHAYADALKKCGADFVFLALDRETFFAYEPRAFEHLSENLRFFTANGFECGVWMQAFGFGGTEKNHLIPNGKYTKIRSVLGEEALDAFCPECESYIGDYLVWIDRVAACGARLIMLDDDLCLSVRPGLGCFCEKHIRLLEKELGESLTGKDLPSLFFTGKPSRYRSAWLKVQKETLLRFAKRVRTRIDAKDPSIRVGFCAGYTSWDIEGADAIELTRTLAGGTKPFLRFTGAPYWVSKAVNRFDGMGLGAVTDMARLQEAWCRNTEIEIFAEADSYPRPRYNVAANLIECFDTAITAAGGMGDLKYLFEYYSSPENETGYVKLHLKNAPLRDFLHKYFDGKKADGIYVAERIKKFGKMTFPDTFIGEGALMNTALSPASAMLSALGIPAVYDRQTDIAVAFNNNVEMLTKLPKKLILDVKAAQILAANGTDVGLSAANMTETPIFEHFENVKTPLFAKSKGDYYSCTLKSGARAVSYFENSEGLFPSAYTYDNGEQEFLVLCFDAYTVPFNSSLFVSYGRQKQISGFANNRFCIINGQPWIYQICKKTDNTVALFFQNLCEDTLFDFDIELDDNYKITALYGIDGYIKDRRLKVTTEVSPYGTFAAVLELEN